MLEVWQRKAGLPFRMVWFAKRPSTFIIPTIFMQTGAEVDSRLFVRIPFYTLHTLLNRKSDDIRRDLNATSRNEVSRAARVGNTFSEIALADFIHMAERARAQGAPGVSLDASHLERYSPHMQCFTVEVGAVCVAAIATLVDADASRMRLMYSLRVPLEASLPPADLSAASRFLHWQALLTAKQQGLRVFDWGGVAYGDDAKLQSITRFKASFGGARVTEFNYLPRPWFRNEKPST